MKKIINRPESVVTEMCHGMAMAHSELKFIEKHKIMVRRNLRADKVSLISGGGSGHEPAHAGYVGVGMLDAAVCGDVFAPPSQIQVYHAIRETQSDKGTLLIIKNYSGDMMNFQSAAYLAQEDGIQVDYVKVDDDIAVQDSLYTVGRRGVAGTVFVHKIAGAAAERGYALARVKALAERTIQNVRTIGFAETSCTVPAKGTPTFALGEDEIEYGVGIHGEPGIRREKITEADRLANRMVSELLNSLDAKEDDEVAVMVNGLGGTPLQELYILHRAVRQTLSIRGIKVAKTLVGNYITSIEMAGASISLLKLDDELKELLFDPCDTPALKISSRESAPSYYELQQDQRTNHSVRYDLETDPRYACICNERLTMENIIYMVDTMSACIIRNEVSFCELDSHAGDGDFGMSVANGFRKLKENWAEILEHEHTIGSFLDACSLVIMEHCGGASGPIWGAAFRAAGKAAGVKTSLSAVEFASMLQSAVKGIQDIGKRTFGRGAVMGDKTLIDALIPCANSWSQLSSESLSLSELFRQGAQAAVDGAKNTETIIARMGRAGTVGKRSLGYPDAGAYALGVIFTELAENLTD